MNKQQLIDQFAKPPIFVINENEHGLLRGVINTRTCTAEIYLQGAHLTRWRPTGDKPVLFLSEKSAFTPGKAIRGGVPVIFPWFGARSATPSSNRTDGPSHGFARTALWELNSASSQGGNFVLVLTLGADDNSRAFGFDHFFLTYTLTVGTELKLALKVENRGNKIMHFEEALHSYFAVQDVRKIVVAGLAKTEYLDKSDGFKRKLEEENRLILRGQTDRPYVNTDALIQIEDPLLKRTIKVVKANSRTTVIWNPWSELSAKMADMSSEGWTHMLCVEAANAGENLIALGPGEEHTMETMVTTLPLK